MPQQNIEQGSIITSRNEARRTRVVIDTGTPGFDKIVVSRLWSKGQIKFLARPQPYSVGEISRVKQDKLNQNQILEALAQGYHLIDEVVPKDVVEQVFYAKTGPRSVFTCE